MFDRRNTLHRVYSRWTSLLMLAALCLSAFAAGKAIAAEKTLFGFTAPAGTSPDAGLVQGTDGAFYGTTQSGGAAGMGSVFKITSAGVITSLHSFSGSDGSQPRASLVQGSDGNFYGTATGGGTNGYGTVFKITSSGTLTTLYSFQDDAIGLEPVSSLVQGADGNFYGTTSTGGLGSPGGSVYRITPAGAALSLHKFTPDDGQDPKAGLAIGLDGNFYGTTNSAGTLVTIGGGTYYQGQGTVFKITPAGVFTKIYAFSGGNDGGGPAANLVLGSDGSFYGTTVQGGSSYLGTAFKITPAGVLTTLCMFTNSNGAYPSGALAEAADGSFYGTTMSGSATGSNSSVSGNGTIFRLDASGNLTTLHSFTGDDGDTPLGAVILAKDGSFYSTTSGGGTGYGTVFKVDGSGAFYSLYTFVNPNGSSPFGALVADGSGNFYGTTALGGAAKGSIFKITLAGLLNGLHTFSGADGSMPYTALVRGSDGNFYGTAYDGGDQNDGVVFVATPSGDVTVLHSFAGVDGANPDAALIQASDGNFYGSTANGAAGYGTLFRITPGGVFTTLHTFNNADGASVEGALLEGPAGILYGTTYTGGAVATNGFGRGTFFQLTTIGVFTSLHSFTAAEGGNPEAGVVLGADGNYYGTTYFGTSNGFNSSAGTVFKITPTGIVTTLHTFTDSDGAYPVASLLLASDGNFYGTTSSGGNKAPNNVFQAEYGTVFKIAPDGTFTSLYLFNGSDGSGPTAAVVQGPDGNFYGTAPSGGPANLGVVFELDGPPLIPAQLTATPGNGQVTLNWKASGGASTYNVYIGTPGTTASTPTATGVTTTNATINGLTNGTGYQFFVAAVNANGTSSQSNEATATPSSSSSSSGGNSGKSGGTVDLLSLLAGTTALARRRRRRKSNFA